MGVVYRGKDGKMNWFKALNDALAYMEDHMTDHIDYDHLARLALCSKFQFLRTFSLMSWHPHTRDFSRELGCFFFYI
jgi:hypothetical protein